MKETDKNLRRRRIVGIVSLIITLALFISLAVFITWFLFREIEAAENPYEAFKEYILSFGWTSRLVFFGIQALQIIVAPIPGGIVQVGAGMAFGPLQGTLLCMTGIMTASSIVFIFTKKFGVKFVGLFIDPEKINEMKFINSENKLKTIVFLLFFIPGTPKDLLTYFVGLTRMKLHEFIIISTIARFPGLVSSTIGGSIIGEGNWLGAAVLFSVIGLVSLGGMFLYSRIVKTGKKPENGAK